MGQITNSALSSPTNTALADQLVVMKRELEAQRSPSGIIINGMWSLTVDTSNRLVAVWIRTGAVTVLATPS